MTRSIILPFVLLLAITAAGLAAAAYSGSQLKSSAREVWLRQAYQDADRITEVVMAWWSNLRTQLRSVAATHASSSYVSEDELLDTFDFLSSIRASMPLTTINFAVFEPGTSTGRITLRTSTEFDGVMASGAASHSHEQLAQTFTSALQMPDRVVLGPVFDDAGRRLAAIAMAATSGDEDGAVMALINIGDLLNSLQQLHIDPGMGLRLSDPSGDGKENEPVIFDSTPPEEPAEVFNIVTDVGHTHWRFRWHVQPEYHGGPDIQLARFVTLTGSVLSLMIAAVLGLLLLQNVRIPRTVQERTVELELENADRRKAEEGLREAVERAEPASRAKISFLANMSHEIRTPLNAIMGFAERLGARIQEQRQREYLDSIQASGKALVTLIDEILDLSKVEQGTIQMSPLSHPDSVDSSRYRVGVLAEGEGQGFAYRGGG